MIETHSISYQTQEELLILRRRLQQFNPESCLIQVFSGVVQVARIERLLLELQQVFPGAAVLGASTCGEIHNREVLNGEILVSVCQFSHSRVKTAMVDDFSDLPAAGRQLASELDLPERRAMILFGCGMLAGRIVNAEPLLDSLAEQLPGIIICGGQAGNESEDTDTLVFTEAGVSQHGIAAAMLCGERLDVKTSYNLSWVPIGRKLTITQASGPRVYQIDHQDPKSLYSHYLGEEVAAALPLAAVDFPFLFERDGITMAAHAVGVNADDSFDYIHSFQVGEQVRFGFCHAGLLALGADAMAEAISHDRPEATFVYSCVSRKWILGADIELELGAVADYSPAAGFFCLGEYFTPAGGKPNMFSQTMTVLCLSEKAEDVAVTPTAATDKPQRSQPESRQFRTLSALHRLLETSAMEIESMHLELAKLGRKDSLTGLVSRRAYDDRLLKHLKHPLRGGERLSLLLIELDGFAEFSAQNPGLVVEGCLRGCAQVLKGSVTQAGHLAARYSNQVFACLLTDTDQQAGSQLAEQLCQQLKALSLADSRQPLTASIGGVTIQGSVSLSMQFVKKTAERTLERAQQAGGNQVAWELIGEV